MNAFQLIRRVGLAAGLLVLVVGLVGVFATGLATSLPVSMIVADVAALGAIALGVWATRTRYRTASDRVDVPDVEFPLATPTPGDDMDELIYRLTRLREGTLEYRERIHERVREIAVAVIMEQRGISREQAAAMLEDESWTDEPQAASYFVSEGKGARSRSLGEKVKARFTDVESPYERQLAATVAAMEDVAGAGDDADPLAIDDDGRVGGNGTFRSAMRPSALEGDEDCQRITDTVRYCGSRQTHHWTGITAFALLALAMGVLTSQPAVVLSSAIGIAVAAYARVGGPPPLADLEVERTVSDESPSPGDEIEVSVTVENTGGTLLPDLTLVDRVPATVEVTEGTPRLGTALRPGDSATFSYRVVVERGEHSWPLLVVARDLAGAHEREALVDAETTVECVPRLKSIAEMPVRLQTSMYDGEVSTGTGGEGLEFFSLRDYQPGDPKSRIDWKTYARTGEFTTVDFREEHAARVVLLFDGRESSYVSPAPGQKHALNESVRAATDIFAALNDQGHLIGIAGFNGIPCWLGPSTGTLHLERVRELFLEHPALSPLPPDLAESEEGRYVDPMTHVRRQLPSNTQIFLFSPLTDSYAYEVARRLDGAGHLVTIISPDPTAERTVGQRIARLERSVWIKRARDHGIRVLDWDTDRTLPLAIEHTRRKWQS